MSNKPNEDPIDQYKFLQEQGRLLQAKLAGPSLSYEDREKFSGLLSRVESTKAKLWPYIQLMAAEEDEPVAAPAPPPKPEKEEMELDPPPASDTPEDQDGSAPVPAKGTGMTAVEEEPAGDLPEGFLEDDEDAEVEGDEVSDAVDESLSPEDSDDGAAMNNKLRKEMGDVSADLLDKYAADVKKKVVSFFQTMKDETLSLSGPMRELLLTEVGKQGLARIEPIFADWVSYVMREITKSVRDSFEPAEEADPQVDDEIAKAEVESAPGGEEAEVETEEVPEPASVDNGLPAVSAKYVPFRPTGRQVRF
jgi:hypothetical protein